MAVSLTHTTVAVGTNNNNGEIAKEQWNEAHTLSLASQRVLGRTASGTGAAEELKGMWVEVSRATASNSATIDFTGIDSTASVWAVELHGIIPITTADYLMMRVSSDGGSTFAGSAGDYSGIYFKISQSDIDAVVDQDLSEGMAYGVPINASSMPDDTDSPNCLGLFGTVLIQSPSTTGLCVMSSTSFFAEEITAEPTRCRYNESLVVRDDAVAVNAIRFLFDGGNISSGTFVLLKRLK